jgi:hypothetical protein
MQIEGYTNLKLILRKNDSDKKRFLNSKFEGSKKVGLAAKSEMIKLPNLNSLR